MKGKIKLKEPDYKAIWELSHRISCVLYESDFSTSYSNRWTDRTMADLNRYLKYGGKLDVIKH